jgi:two-component system, sporulation sensor kinase E
MKAFNPFRDASELNLYQNKNTIKYLLLLVAASIVFVSLYYNSSVVNLLREREKTAIDLFANSIEFLAEQGDNANVTFINENIIRSNVTIPVILTNQHGEPTGAYLNVDVPESLAKDELIEFLREPLAEMKGQNEPVPVVYRNGLGQVEHMEYVYYQDSTLLRQLRYFPYIQLSVIVLFAVLAYLAFSYSRSAEQNQVWVGLAKETAHQLGTPLSSLMAWMDYLRADERTSGHEAIPEMEKDVEKLNIVTERFSQIGSVPVLETGSVYETVQQTVSYLQKRVSSKISITITTVGADLSARMNRPLFGWVIENLCKNAVDAMAGIGKIEIVLAETKQGVVIDISDTGKGMSKSRAKQIFRPGFSTKPRGWGLGLTLAKRIIENYHGGRIYVKHSEPNKGTTFRIVLHR